MAKSVFEGIRIKAISASVPTNKVNNLTDHELLTPDESQKIVDLTGVLEYRAAPPEVCASDLCELSARTLFSGLSIDPQTVDGIIFATMTPDYRIPSTACILQDKLGCSLSTVAFDINMGCSGFVVGLYNACALINGAELKRVLLLAGDTQSKLCYEKDKNVVFLLGDAGSATLIEATGRSEDKLVMEIMTDGSRFDKLFVPAGGCRNPSTEQTRKVEKQPDGGLRSQDHIYMDGMEIFKFSSTDVVKSIQKFMELENLTTDDIDFLVLHQANKFMTDKIARKLKLPLEKVPYSLKLYGNTGSASIPLTIVHNYEGLMSHTKNRCLFSGFGVGLSWGIASVSLDQIYCPPVIEL